MRGLTKEEARLMRCSMEPGYEIDASGGDHEEAVCAELVSRGLLRVSREGGFLHWTPTAHGLMAIRVCTVS
jgi:hypothetical protein